MSDDRVSKRRLALVVAALAMMSMAFFGLERGEEPCEDCPPDSELVIQWKQTASRVADRLALQIERGVLAVDLRGWLARSGQVAAALAEPDDLDVLVIRGRGRQIVAVDGKDYDLVWLQGPGWGLVAVSDQDYDLVLREGGGGSTLGYAGTTWDMVAVDDQDYDLVAVAGLPKEQLEVSVNDYDMVAINDHDWDLVAASGHGRGVARAAENAWGRVATAEASHAWRDYLRALDSWLPSD